MQRINKNTVGVYNYLGLKDSLENNTDTFIYLGSSILTNGIKINARKTNVIIDGTYQGVTFTIMDKSMVASDTIYIASSNNKTLRMNKSLSFIHIRF